MIWKLRLLNKKFLTMSQKILLLKVSSFRISHLSGKMYKWSKAKTFFPHNEQIIHEFISSFLQSIKNNKKLNNCKKNYELTWAPLITKDSII